MLGPLTAYSIDSVTLDGLQNILYTHGANPGVTQAIQSAVTKQWRSHSLAPALRSEIAFHMDCVAFLRRIGPKGLKQIIGSGDGDKDASIIPPGAPWATFLDANAAYLLNGLPSLIAAVDKPYPSAYPLFKAREDELDATDTANASQSTSRMLALVLSPRCTTGLLRRAEVAAQADALATSAALLAYRHAHGGAFPATLAAAGISPLPVDPFNGKSLQYQRTGNGAGFVLSSVGSSRPRHRALSLRYPPAPR